MDYFQPDTLCRVKKYHPDLMEGYCNAVNFLIDITYPLADKTFKDFIDTIELKEEIKDMKEKLLLKRKIFKQINIMFERIDFFGSSEFRTE